MLPHTHVTFAAENSAIQRLYDVAVSKCLENIQVFAGRRVLVEGGGYEKVWLETQPMGGEMYAKRDMDAALNNQLIFMTTQRADGRLPGSVKRLSNGSIQGEFNKFQGFCFPEPALNMYYWLGEEKDYLDLLYDALSRFDAYLWRTRDSNHDGCLESFCVYDTGEDNALRYGDAPNYCEMDTPPKGSRTVPMASMDVMSYSYAARDTLAKISRIRKDGMAMHWKKGAQEVADALKLHLWDEARGACFDKDKSGRTIDVLCHNSLRCMYFGSFSQSMADRFVRDHLLNPQEFWTPLPLPSVAANDPLFRNAPENNWSGQCEGLTYQRAIRGLERYGYEPLVTALGKKLLHTLINHDNIFTQQFDPFTGIPSRVSPITKAPLPKDVDEPFQHNYGPTILSALEYISRIWGVHMQEGIWWFSAIRGMAFTYEQGYGDRVYCVESDGRQACIRIDGREIHHFPCGQRIMTDAGGTLLARRNIESPPSISPE